MCRSLGWCVVVVIIHLIVGPVLPGAELTPGRAWSGGTTRAAAPPLVFQLTGSTTGARDLPLAVTLANGQVLVTGGRDATGTALTASELYDPLSGWWTPTTAMAHGHAGGCCVLLPSGHVLVAGGDPTAEVFDPESATWSGAGTIPGSSIALCVLGDGEVLATTGAGTAMRWSEGAAVWSATAAMPSLVSGTGVIALPDGGALAFGGVVYGTAVTTSAACSRFDPVSGQWTATASMSLPRHGAQAVLLEGTGTGTSSGSSSATVLVVGGSGDDNIPLTSCEAYDPGRGTWSLLTGAVMPFSSGGRVTLLLSGQVLVTGGENDGALIAQAECFDPAAGSWSVTPPMLAAHVDHACVALADGSALVIDGLTQGADGTVLSTACERYQAQGVNAPPTFALGSDVSVDENSAAFAFPGWIQSIQAGPLFDETVTFQLNVSHPELFSVLPAIDASGTLTGAVAADVSGASTVSVVARNSGGTANGGVDTSPAQSFTITVAFVNQPPTWSPGPSPTVSESSAALVLPGWATQISPGPPSQAAETVMFTLSADHPEYFSVQPQITSDGTLSATPASGRFGVATVTAVLTNSGGTANGGQDAAPPVQFTISITHVIQQPTVPSVTMCDLVGTTVSAAVVISDPDQVLDSTAVPIFQVTGVCHLGQLSLSATGLASMTATTVGTETVAIQVSVAGVVLTSTIVVAVTDEAAARPHIISVPAAEWGQGGAPWVYDLIVSPASLAATADLTVTVQSPVPSLATALCTTVSGNQVHLVVPALDSTAGAIQRLMVVAVDRTTLTVDIQVILLVVVGPSAAG